MFDLSSFLRRDSQKPLKSTGQRRSRHRDSRDHDPRHHENPEHHTQSHHSRRHDRDHRPEYPLERRYSDDNDNEREGRQSERRTEDEGYRSPSLSGALRRQPGETRQEMQDRVDGQCRRRPKHTSEQEPRRSPSYGQEEKSPDRRSMPRRPRFTTTTSYRYPDVAMEDPAPGPLPRSATWQSKEPSQRPKSGGESSQLHHSDNQEPSNHRSHRKRDGEPARSPPRAHDDPTITPLQRRHTASTTSDAYKSGMAGNPWSETGKSLFSWSRLDRLPPPGPVRMLGQKDWESKALDQDLAREIAFEDLGVTIEGESPLVPVLTCGIIC
jgi:hypothetical protein